MGRFSPY